MNTTIHDSHLLIHSGTWHSSFSDCNYVKCGWGLGIFNIGSQHWSCCFNTNKHSNGCLIIPRSEIFTKYEEQVNSLTTKVEELTEQIKSIEKRVSIIEYSPPPQGGPEYQRSEREELDSGLLKH